jgi:hypothetical protein
VIRPAAVDACNGKATFGLEISAMSADQYLRYDPSVEHILPEEAAAVEEIVASISRTSDRTFRKDKHGTRQQHAKGAGYLRGELIVYDNLPDHLRQGLFKQAGHFPIIVRLSTAFNRSDRVRSPRGFAIKVLGVTGAKALGDDDSTNQVSCSSITPAISRMRWPICAHSTRSSTPCSCLIWRTDP